MNNDFDINDVQNSFNLNEHTNLEKSINIIEDFLRENNDDFIKSLGYESVVKELLQKINSKSNIDNNTIKLLAKKYNEENNQHLINKRVEYKEGILNRVLGLFRKGANEEIINDTAAYDIEEQKIFDEFYNITRALNNYISRVNELKGVINEEKFNIIIVKVFNYEDISVELNELLKLLKYYKERQKKYINNEQGNLEEIKLNEENLISEEIEEDIEMDTQSKLLIADLFNDNIFKIFVNYCNDNDIITLNQLKSFDFNDLDQLRGFGVGKKQKLIERYIEVTEDGYIKNISESDNCNEVAISEVEVNIIECYKGLDIAVLLCFNKINEKIIEQIRSANLNTIEELYMKVYSVKLDIPNLGATKIKNIKEVLDKFKIEPMELFNLLIDEIKENPDYDILRRRAIGNETLQQIGESFGITRERIRQKEKKVVKTVEAVLNLFINISNSNLMKLDNIEVILGVENLSDEEKRCLTYVLKNTEVCKASFLEELGKFLVNGNVEELKNKINIVANGMPDIVNIHNELIYDLYEYDELSIFSLDEVVKIILTLGYKQVNDYLFRGNVSKTRIYNFIVKEFFKDGITFSNEEDVNKFINILKEKFDKEDESIRNIKAKIETYCVLCDRGSYIHPDWVEVDERLLEDVRAYIDDNNQETLYLNQIYSEFESDLIKAGIGNRYYLQGILKYHFADIYNFTKDILYRGNIKHDRNYIFNKYIKDKGRVVSKEELESDLKGWTPIMFTMASDECRYVLKWDNGAFTHASRIHASLEDISGIIKTLYNVFIGEKESITDNEAFEILSENFKAFFENNDIDSSFKLFSVLEYLVSKEYYFRRPYILKNKPEESVSAVYFMKKLFNDNAKVTLEQLKEYCISIKLTDSTRMQSINKLLKDTVEIEKETYILKENFEIEENAVDAVREILVPKINEKGYLALKGIEEYLEFPRIKYQWNAYLLRDICEYYIPEIRELKKQFYDKRYSVPVVVPVDSELNELLDLIIKILKDKFNDGIGINELTKYLKNENIIHDKIPFELFNCDEVLVEDNFAYLN